LHLWGRNGVERQYLINVTPTDSRRTAAEINLLLNNSPRIRAHAIGDKVVLDGNNPTEEDAYRGAEIMKRFPQAISLVSRGGYERMIDMEVRMIEIGKNALDRLGVRWQSGGGVPYAIDGPAFGLIGDFKRSDAFKPGGEAEAAGFAVRPRISPFATSASLVTSLTSMVDLLVQSGDAAVLAEPRLSCRSGGSARFVAGGELPIPVIGANGSASVQFKEYGVRFEVSPTVNEQGVISASLHAEISSINPEVMVREVPGLRKQSAATEVNLREGETLVIAGMVSNEISGSVDKIPGLGDLPILGKLFRSRRFQNRETELIVLITPRLHVDGSTSGAEEGAQMSQRLESLREQIRMLD
jgi:Flp pilus assembly secretin CpaC